MRLTLYILYRPNKSCISLFSCRCLPEQSDLWTSRCSPFWKRSWSPGCTSSGSWSCRPQARRSRSKWRESRRSCQRRSKWSTLGRDPKKTSSCQTWNGFIKSKLEIVIQEKQSLQLCQPKDAYDKPSKWKNAVRSAFYGMNYWAKIRQPIPQNVQPVAGHINQKVKVELGLSVRRCLHCRQIDQYSLEFDEYSQNRNENDLGFGDKIFRTICFQTLRFFTEY